MPATTCWLLAFILSAIVTGIKGQCGNDTTQPSYLAPGARNFLFSPSYPDPYPSNISCRWSLETNEGYRFRLRSTQFQLRTSDRSCVDIFRVYDGDSVLSPLLYSSCNETFQPINSSSRYLLVTFTSGISDSASGGFFIIYESFKYIVTTSTSTTTVLPTREAFHCGVDNLTAEAGTYGYITSPGFPNSYPNDATCMWSVKADNSSIRAVRLDIVRIDLEFSPNCSFDSITIYDVFPTWREEVRRLCSYLEESIISRGLYLLVMFTSDSDFSGRGFQLRYTSVAKPPPTSTTASTRSTSTLSTTTRQSVVNVTAPSNGSVCSYTPVSLNVFSGEVRYLQSPYYPNRYFNNSGCYWQISTNNNFVIKMTVEAAYLDTCFPCGACDFLVIYDGQSDLDRSLGKVCNTNSQTVFYSTGPYLYLILHTNAFSRGFRLRYEAVDEMNTPTPASTPSTSTISTTTRQPSFGETTPSLNGTVCSSTPVSLNAFIEQVRYLESPNYPRNYFNNADCQWRISTGNNLFVKITVEAANFEQCMVCGSCDFLEIFDGPSTLAAKLGTVCDTTLQTVFYSSGPQLYLRLRTDTSIVYTGFRLRYEAVANMSSPTPVCNSMFSSLMSSYGKQKLLQFESYANQGNSQVCSWIIRSDIASRIVRVSFDHFTMQYCSSGDCECGFLDIYDGLSEFSPRLIRLCGTKVMPLVMFSTGNSLYLTFNGGGTWHPKSFALQYESVTKTLQSEALSPGINSPTTNSCSTHPVRLKAMYGVDRLLTSPSFLPQNSINTYCDWLITSDPGYIIQLTTFTANLEDCRDCICQRVDIFDGPSNYSTKLVGICSSFTQPVNSTGQLMYIRFSTNTVVRHSGFSLLYHQVLQSEGLTDSSISNSGYDLKLTGLVGGILGATLLFVALAFILFVYFNRLSRKQKQTPKISGNKKADSSHSPLNPTEPSTNDVEDTALTSVQSTSAPPTSTPSTSDPPTSSPSTSAPPTSASTTSATPTSAPSTSAPPTSAPTTSALLTSGPPTSISPTKKQKQTPKTRGKKKAASNHIPLNPTAPPANDDEDIGLTSAPPTSHPFPSSPPTFAPPTRTSSLYPNLSYINQENLIQAKRSTGGTLALPAAVPLAHYLETGRDNPAFINDPSTVGDNIVPLPFTARGYSDV